MIGSLIGFVETPPKNISHLIGPDETRTSAQTDISVGSLFQIIKMTSHVRISSVLLLAS